MYRLRSHAHIFQFQFGASVIFIETVPVCLRAFTPFSMDRITGRRRRHWPLQSSQQIVQNFICGPTCSLAGRLCVCVRAPRVRWTCVCPGNGRRSKICSQSCSHSALTKPIYSNDLKYTVDFTFSPLHRCEQNQVNREAATHTHTFSAKISDSFPSQIRSHGLMNQTHLSKQS